jgi:hypothetical protein
MISQSALQQHTPFFTPDSQEMPETPCRKRCAYYSRIGHLSSGREVTGKAYEEWQTGAILSEIFQGVPSGGSGNAPRHHEVSLVLKIASNDHDLFQPPQPRENRRFRSPVCRLAAEREVFSDQARLSTEGPES